MKAHKSVIVSIRDVSYEVSTARWRDEEPNEAAVTVTRLLSGTLTSLRSASRGAVSPSGGRRWDRTLVEEFVVGMVERDLDEDDRRSLRGNRDLIEDALVEAVVDAVCFLTRC